MKIPLCKPNITDEEIKAATKVLKSGWLAHGPKSSEFEELFARYIGTRFAISFNSCTSALQVAIQALGLNGEIIVPSFTFVASANSIITAGCKPVLADVEYDTCNISVDDIKKRITKNTVAIMPVHYSGQSCRMNEIMEVAKEKNLVVIEDSAESIGAEYLGKKTGNFGVGCFSFYPTKNMTTGEGGMMTTNDGELARKVRTLMAHGIPKDTWIREREKKPWLREAVVPGYNYRLCDIQAAIGIAQLRKLDDMNNLRRIHARYLNKNLDFEGIDLPVELKECKHVYQMYTIKVKKNRDEFILKLRERGVGASVHFDPPVHLNPYYKKNGYNLSNLKICEKISSTIVTLPMYPSLTREELDYIISSVKETLKNIR